MGARRCRFRLPAARGFARCYLCRYVDGLFDGGFLHTDEVAPNEFMYSSLVSITSVGDGDLAPAPLGRLVGDAQAVVGQVYPVAVASMLVGLTIQQRAGDGGRE